jgi:hypothetical protein
MKLPTEALTKPEKLEEFDAWITPSLVDVRRSPQFADRHAASVRAFDRLCEATDNFAREGDLTHGYLADNLVKLFAGRSEDEVKHILMDLANVLFLITGKSGNSAKCQFPLYIKTILKRVTIPKAKVTRRKGEEARSVEQKTPPRTIVTSTYMGWVADLHHSPTDQRDLIDTFLKFVLDEDVYLSQLWSMGRGYALLKPLGRSNELLNPLIVMLVRGSVAATGGHEPERIMRAAMEDWGLAEGIDFNSSDVKLNAELNILEETALEGEAGRREKTRAYDFALPYKVTGWPRKILIQSQYYAGDSGSVSHKTVDQATASRQEATKKLGAGVRFLEYLDGAGFFASLNTDLRSLLDMTDTAGIVQIRSTPIRLRREIQLIGFLTPLEVEHAILIVGTDRKRIAAHLTREGYNAAEVDRCISAAVDRGLLLRPDEDNLDISAARRDVARRYFLLDMTVIAGRTLNIEESSAPGLVFVPGYGPYHGLSAGELQTAAEDRARSLIATWATVGAFAADLAWLAERGYAVVNRDPDASIT